LTATTDGRRVRDRDDAVSLEHDNRKGRRTMGADEHGWTIWTRGPSTGWAEPTQEGGRWASREHAEKAAAELRAKLAEHFEIRVLPKGRHPDDGDDGDD
jgi:hypothetical protein